MYYKPLQLVGTMGVASIWLNDDVDNPLYSLAKKLLISKNYLINQAIREFLVKHSLEDSKWQDTLDALESIKADQSVDEADVNAWLNTWGTGTKTSHPNYLAVG